MDEASAFIRPYRFGIARDDFELYLRQTCRTGAIQHRATQQMAVALATERGSHAEPTNPSDGSAHAQHSQANHLTSGIQPERGVFQDDIEVLNVPGDPGRVDVD